MFATLDNLRYVLLGVLLRLGAVGLAFVLVIVGLTSPARGQLTVDQLIGRAVADVEDPKYADVAAAMTAFGDGDISGARALLGEVVGNHPELSPADVMLARLFFAADQTAGGRGALEDAVVRAPDDPEAYLLLGDLALREGRIAEAQLLFAHAGPLCGNYERNALRRRNLQIGVHAGLATVAEARGDWPRAERSLRDWITLDEQSIVARARLGRALFHQKKFGPAYQVFQEARQSDPSAPQPELNMALLYEELVAQGDASKRDSAKRAMQQAVQNDPEDLNTRLTVAQWALETCQIELADANARAALEIDGRSLQAKLLVGLIGRHLQDYDGAEAAFESAHLQAPENFTAINQLALVLIQRPEPERQRRALQYARLSVQARADRSLPLGREAAVTLGWVLFRLGSRADALLTMQAAQQAGSLSDESSYFVAHVLAESGRSDEAERLIRRVLDGKGCFASRQAAQQLYQRLTESDRQE